MKYKNHDKVFYEINHTIDSDIALPLLHFSIFQQEDWVKDGFTTRAGGVSQGQFESLNLSFTRGDDEAAVMENYRRVADAFDLSTKDIVTSDQTHTTNVRLVTDKDAGKGIVTSRDYTDVDGLITNTPGILLATFYADCVPLYFVDPVHKAIGLSHSGWRGTVARMGKVTIGAMADAFGTKPQDLLCGIGPSICQECYEVSEDVANAFAEEFLTHKDELLIAKGNQKYQLDLWKANQRVLLDAGVMAEHIATTNLCTCCNDKMLFSHRASKGKRGNLGAFLTICK